MFHTVPTPRCTSSRTRTSDEARDSERRTLASAAAETGAVEADRLARMTEDILASDQCPAAIAMRLQSLSADLGALHCLLDDGANRGQAR